MKETMSLDDIHQRDLETTIERLTAEDVERLQAHRGEFVELPCAACRWTELTFAFEAQGFTYKRCRRCGLLMLSPAPDAARQLWYIETSEALRFWRECMPASVRGSRQKMYDERARYVNDCLARYGTEVRRVVEVGAGNGEFAEAFLRSNRAIDRMVLIEPQPMALHAARIEVVSSPVEKWASQELFDAAISWEVLEHLLEPDAMLHSIRERLTPGGLLILSTPNENSFETRLLQGKSGNLLYDHVRLYNPDTIVRLLQRVGFEVLETTTPGQLDVELVRRAYKDNKINLESMPAVRFLMEEGYQYRHEFQDFLRRNNQSSHMRCVARRPRST